MKKFLSTLAIVAFLTSAAMLAQSWTTPRTWSTGEQVTATIMNAHVRDNETVLRAGGISVASQATGDLLCASSSTQFARLADVATGSVLQSGGVGACPAYSANLNVTGTGVHLIGGSGTSASSLIRLSGASGTGLGSFVQFQRNGANSGDIGTRAAIIGGGTSGDLILYTDSGFGLGFLTNGSTSERWGINTAGDFTFGASAHIADSNGTPSISSGWGVGPSIAGTDYAFKITAGTGSSSGGTITFGHTFSSAPVCSVLSDLAEAWSASTTTTSISIQPNDGSVNAGVGVMVLCRGY